MKSPDTTLQLPALDDLLRGCPEITPTETLRGLSDEAYARQLASVARRGTNASVIGILTTMDNRIVLVNRQEGSHQGWALPSGSVAPREEGEPQETFSQAVCREVMEEVDIDFNKASRRRLVAVERRIFQLRGSNETQQVHVATFHARLVAGQAACQTAMATREGLEVTAVPLDALPDRWAFNDREKICEYALAGSGVLLATA